MCYAEKTHGNFVLPFISTSKSPQQIMGSLVKSVLASRLGLEPSSVYHVSVEPCFDKKLEASRMDFFDEDSNSKDVDCVITSSKLELNTFTKELDVFILCIGLISSLT